MIVPAPVTGAAWSVTVAPGVKICPAVGLVMDTIGEPEPPPPVEVGEGLGVGLGEGLVGVEGDALVGVGLGVGVGGGEPVPLQVVPLRVKAVGAVLVPV